MINDLLPPNCDEIISFAPEFLKKELSRERMNTCIEHIKNCPECKKYFSKELAFERALKEASKEELDILDISSERMKKLNQAILKEIARTPQIVKTKISLEEDKNRTKTIQQTNTILDIANLISKGKSLLLQGRSIGFAIAALSLFVIYYHMPTTKLTSLFKTKTSLKAYSIAEIKSKINEYQTKRNVLFLYDTNSNHTWKNLIHALTKDISQFNPELQRTIIHKIKTTNFFRKKIIKPKQNIAKRRVK